MPAPALAAILARVGPMAAGAAGRGAATGGVASGGQGLAAVAKNLAKVDGASGGASRGLSSTVMKFKDLYGNLRQGAQDIAVAKYAFTNAADGISSKTVMAATMLKGFADQFNQLVSLSAPSAVEQFNIAFNDTVAVMGRGMLPITKALTGAMRKLGDNFARWEPVINQVATAFGAGIDKVFGSLDRLWKQNGPAMTAMGEVMTVVIDKLSTGFSRLVDIFGYVLKQVNRFNAMFGLGFGDKTKPGASAMGAAVRNVSTVTNAESLSQRAIEKAMAGMINGGNKAPEEKQVDLLGELGGELKVLSEYIRRHIPTQKDVEEFINQLVRMIPTPQDAIDRGKGAIDASLAGRLLNALGSQATR